MWSAATRSLNMNGPTHTGFCAKLPPDASAFGERIIPARSASCAVSGEYGAERCRTTVVAFGAETVLIGEISLLRTEPVNVRYRSSVVLTAAALNGVPSLNLTPVRSLIV